MRTGIFNISILTEAAPFSLFQRFGFKSGKDADKFAGYPSKERAANGLRYVPEYANGVITAMVKESHDFGTHTLFAAHVNEAFTLPGGRSATYQYYFDHIKPKPKPFAEDEKKQYVCKVCGYIYDGDNLPADFICPTCKHGAVDFELV
jgi:flavin reductase (DIM6/NTAB) family NADH-FMN oxidoreductase RutF